MPDDNAQQPSALDQATRERDRFRDRAAWWEDHKGVVMLPAMIVGLGAGYGLGFGIGSAVGFPDPTRWFGAVIGLLAVGRAIGSYFDPRRLVAAQKRVDHLRAQNDRAR
jgi:hypothetical protein